MATVSLAAILLSEILLFEIFASGEIYKTGFSYCGAGGCCVTIPGVSPRAIKFRSFRAVSYFFPNNPPDSYLKSAGYC